MSDTNYKYWMVHNPINRAPSVKHETLELANAEAKRLAELHLGETFFVLEAVTAFCVSAPKATELRVEPAPRPA